MKSLLVALDWLFVVLLGLFGLTLVVLSLVAGRSEAMKKRGGVEE